jgi:peptidoglycan hydrolase CwlO-like protein
MTCDKCKRIFELFENLSDIEKNNRKYFNMKHELIDKRKAVINFSAHQERIKNDINELKGQINELQKLYDESDAEMNKLIADIDLLEKLSYECRFMDTAGITEQIRELRESAQ